MSRKGNKSRSAKGPARPLVNRAPKTQGARKKGNTRRLGRNSGALGKASRKADASTLAVRDYARLVLDPCMGPLVRSVGGENGANIVERTRITYAVPTTAGSYNGYVVWFPSFHSAGGVGANTPANMYSWECTAANLAVRPLNTVAVPMGINPATSGTFWVDPMSGVLSGTSPFSRAKAIAACMQLDSIGSISSLQGAVCTVVNISLSTFNMNSGAAGTYQPPSVQEMLSYAAKRERINLDGHEVVWGPNEGDSIFRTNGTEDSGTAVSAVGSLPNVAFWQGNAGVSATECPNPNPDKAMGVLIAWSGLTSGTAHVQLNFTKVAELELAPRGFAVEQNIAPKPSAKQGPMLSGLLADLDEMEPGWRAHAVRHAKSAAATITGTVLAGSPYLASLAKETIMAM